jgi:hypothetical protein
MQGVSRAPQYRYGMDKLKSPCRHVFRRRRSAARQAAQRLPAAGTNVTPAILTISPPQF